tara:strand:+ start:655 stop:2577 length:1923 start_codon:yes stop_codon:yes gene_type:complete
VRFRTLEVDNFIIISHGSIDLANQGLVRISGENLDASPFDSNGSGKSSLIEALVWVLWGKTSQGLTADSVVNSKVGRDCRVALDIEDEDSGDLYQVVRYRKHRKYRNEVQLHCNGKDVSGSTNAVTQALIEDLMGVDYRTFLNSVVFSHAGSVKRFTEMTDLEQKEVFERILSLDWVTNLHSQMVDERKRIRSSLSTQHANLKQIQQSILDESDNLNTYVEEEVKFDASKQERIDELTEKRKLLRRERKSSREKIVNNQEYIDASTRKVSDVKSKLTSLEQKYLAGKERLSGRLKDVEVALGISDQSLKRISTKERQINTDDVGTECPVCRQDVTQEHIDRLLADLIKERESLETDQTKNLVRADEIKLKLEEYRKKYQRKVDKLTETLNDYREELRELQDTQRMNRTIQHRIEGIDSQLRDVDLELKRAKERENVFSDLAADSEATLRKLRSELVVTRARIALNNQRLESCEFWVEGFSTKGIRSLLLDGVVGSLNSHAEFYSDLLTGGAIDIGFSTQKQLKSGEFRDSFTITTSNVSGATEYAANSKGERRRIDLCVALSIADLLASRSSKRFNIIALDEVFDNLDESGKEAVMALLNYLSTVRESVFVITHLESLKSQFPNEIRVVRSQGVAEVRSN